MPRIVPALALAGVLHQTNAFTGGCPLDSALRSTSSVSSPASFQRPSSWRHPAPASAARSLRRLRPSAAAFQPPAASKTSSSLRNAGGGCACDHGGPWSSRGGGYENDRRRRRQRPVRCSHEDAAVWRARRRPLPSSSASSLCAVKDGGSSSSSASSRGALRGSPPPPEELQELREDGESGATPAAAAAPGAWRKAGKKGGKETEKSVFGKAGDALKAAFNVFMAASTVASLFLAAEAIWQLHGTQLTLSNAVPTLTKLLPLTGIGVFGAAQLVGLVARVVRVVVTLPIMLSGTWVILQNAPKLLPQGSDFSGAGSLAALLATPEVLEAAAVLALLAGTAAWAVNFAAGTVGALLPLGRQGDSSQEEEFDEFEE